MIQEFRKINLFEERKFDKSLHITFSFIRQNLWNMLKSLYVLIPFLIIMAYLQSLYQLETINNPGSISPLFSIKYVLLMISSLLLCNCIFAFSFGYMIQYSESDTGNIDVGIVWQKVKKGFLPLLVCIFLYLLTCIIGTMLLVIPGIILSVSLSLCTYAYMAENVSILGSFKRSFKLVSNKWWETLGFIIVLFFIIFPISLIFGIPAMVIPFASQIGLKILETEIYIHIANFISVAGNLIVLPILYIGFGVLYFSRRTSKDHLVLEQNIDLIGSESSDN